MLKYKMYVVKMGFYRNGDRYSQPPLIYRVREKDEFDRRTGEEKVYRHMFRYLPTLKSVEKVKERRHFEPISEEQVSFYNSAYEEPHVNFTEAAPEEGRMAISGATGLEPSLINYCLEVLVETNKVEQRLPLERSYQIYSDKNIPLWLLYVHNMNELETKLKKGSVVKRYQGENNVPIVRVYSLGQFSIDNNADMGGRVYGLKQALDIRRSIF